MDESPSNLRRGDPHGRRDVACNTSSYSNLAHPVLIRGIWRGSDEHADHQQNVSHSPQAIVLPQLRQNSASWGIRTKLESSQCMKGFDSKIYPPLRMAVTTKERCASAQESLVELRANKWSEVLTAATDYKDRQGRLGSFSCSADGCTPMLHGRTRRCGGDFLKSPLSPAREGNLSPW